MQAHFVKLFEGEEHRPFYWQGETSCAALLIHGFPGSPAEMRPTAQILHQSGWTVQAPLLPGFGPDIETLPERTYLDWVLAAETAYLELRRTHQQVIICGNSMGGALALYLAARHHPDALILFAPFWRVDHFLWKALPVIKFFLPRVKPFRIFKLDFSDPDVRQGILEMMPEADIDDPEVRQAVRDFEVPITMFNQIRILGKKGYEAASDIDVPALAVQGQQDDIVNPKLTRRLLEQLRGTVQYHEVDSSHDLLDADAPVWPQIEQHIREFLQQFGVRP